MPSDPKSIVVDADVLMNLLGTGYALEILQDLRFTLLIPPTVADEVLYLESPEVGGQREQIDLTPLEEAGVLVRLELEGPEIERVIDLARTVGDGEAEVIAVALTRTLTMATDDRKARRLASEQGTSPLSTPDILSRWQSSADIPSDRMGQILSLVTRRSRYRPPAAHPLYEWWMSQI